jgi:hypothetical protein
VVTFIALLFVASNSQIKMQLLLKENGNLHDNSGRDDDKECGEGVCEDQTAALLNVLAVSQLPVLLAPTIGLLSDRKGAQYN